jgi:hypothetical protein
MGGGIAARHLFAGLVWRMLFNESVGLTPTARLVPILA